MKRRYGVIVNSNNGTNSGPRRTKIGGQALMEGIMMRGLDCYSVAVRRPDGGIELEVKPDKHLARWYSRVPFVRGIFNFVSTLVLGYTCLMRSAEISGALDEEDPPKAPAPANEGSGEGESAPSTGAGEEAPSASPAPVGEGSAPEGTGSGLERPSSPAAAPAGEGESAGGERSAPLHTAAPAAEEKEEKGLGAGFSVAVSVLAVFLALALFMVLPTAIVGGLGKLVELGRWRTPLEGLVKLCIFLGYMALVSRMKEIRRMFEYHGAEHKTIACYEHGEALTVENVRRHRRFHPRCGTSFLLIVILVSILVSSFVSWQSLWLRMALKVLLLPLVMGISYEIIKYAGGHDNLLTKVLSAPGLWLQRLTVKEPDDSMIEVAVAAMEAVIPQNGEDDRW